MAKFWLATFGNAPPAPLKMTALNPDVSPAEPLVEANDPPRAIEIIENNGEYAVLFSIVDDPDDPKMFMCRMASRMAQSCAVWSVAASPLATRLLRQLKATA